MNARVARRVRKLRIRRMITRIKQEVGCEGCGAPFKASLLQLHHTDPEQKLFKASDIVRNGTFAALQREIEKCEILCEVCHKGAHYVG